MVIIALLLLVLCHLLVLNRGLVAWCEGMWLLCWHIAVL